MADSPELFRLLPIPAQRLTRAVATRWLKQWGYSYIRAVGCGMRVKGADAKDAYEMLAIDVASMVDACARALATGKPQRLVSQWSEDPAERPDILRQLAVLVANRMTGDGAMPGAEADAFDALAERLVELLAEREAA